MIAVMIEEWREWKQRYALRCFIILASFTGGTLLISKMHFIYFFLVIALFFVWLGWQGGSQKWNEIKFLRIRNTKKMPFPQWFGGKHFGFLAISLIHGILLLPMILLMIFLWGIPPSLCLCILGIGIASGAMTLTLCILTQWINPVFGSLLSVTIIIAWLLGGYFLPYPAPINPLMLILNLIDTGNIRPTLFFIGTSFACQILLAALLQMIPVKAHREAY